MAHRIEYRYGTSRGRDTYGYRIVTLYVDGVKTAQQIGGGYDMHGACLGEWLTNAYQDRLKPLTANYGSGDDGGYYGLVHWDGHERTKRAVPGGKTYVDGMCGESSVAAIARAIGVEYYSL